MASAKILGLKSKMSHPFQIINPIVLLVLSVGFLPGSSATLSGPHRFLTPMALAASFTYSPTNPRVGQVVTFTGTGTGGTSPYTFNWNFGDGGTATGSVVKHIFITLQAFKVSVTATDSIGASNSFQNSVYVGSLNSRVNCTPIVARISDITANATGTTSFNNSPFSPGITTTVNGGVAKRWLTLGPTPNGWHSPGPACTITNNHGQSQAVFVEIDNIKRASAIFEDSSTSYDATNGGSSYGGGTFNDFTYNAFDPAIVSDYQNSCTSANDPTCYGRIHMEIDHDWQAAGYCGTGTACDPNALSSQTTAATTLIDFQGFIFWDGQSCCSSQDHSFSGWELHPLTGWRIHQAPLTVSISSSPSNPNSGQTVSFTATVFGGTSPYTYNWDFGDGTVATGNPATHSYPTGTYNVHLGVTDTKGAIGVEGSTISVGGGGGNPDFTISSSPSTLTVQSGSSANSTINLAGINNFSGTISLTAQSAPAGLTASTSPTSITLSSGGSGSSTLTVSSSTPGTYTVIVNATSGSTSHSTNVSVSVTAAPDFSISSNPASTWLQAGAPATSTIQLASLNGFSGTISLSTTISPSGLNASLSPASISLSSGGSASSTLTFTSSTPGNSTITVTGTSGALTHTSTVKMTGVSSLVVSDSATGPSSLFPTGGAKLIQDSASRMIAVYVDNSGRIGLVYDNSNPMAPTWSTPVKSATPTFAYASPTAILLSPTSLRIIAIGGTGSGVITDIPVTITRDPLSNIAGLSFGTPTVIDSSGLDKYPAAVLAHNGNILLAWGYANSTRSEVKTLRWSPSTGWTSLTGSSSLPDIVLVDPTNLQYFVPAIIERADNSNVYILANRNPGPPSTIAYNKATWNRSGWTWGSGNLTYETNASDADDDPVGMAWDPTKTLIVAVYGITGTHTYGVFTLNALDQKTHIDTPSLAVTGDRGWANIGVHISTGDYYVFLISVNTDAGSGPLGYIRCPSGGSWNSTINWLDAATDNQVLTLKPTSQGPTLDLLYAEGTSSPAKVKFVRLSPFNPPDFNISPSPASLTGPAGSPATSTITMTSLYGFSGSVSLSTVVTPLGLTVSQSPSTLTLTGGGTANSTLTITSSLVPGTYTVTITATSGPLSHTTTVTITVQDIGPNVTFLPSSTSSPTGTPITLTISATDIDGSVTSIRVVWGDGGVDNLAGTITTDSHSYPSGGLYPVYVNATDNAGLTTKSTVVMIAITDRPPAVSFTASQTNVPTGTTIVLTITASDPDGYVSSMKVSWGDGTVDSMPGTATSDSHDYAIPGNYSVYVNATDNANLTVKSAPSTITVNDRPPIVSITPSTTTAPTGTIITLTITSTDPDGSIVRSVVVWGDGTVDILAGAATNDLHAYQLPGLYTPYVNATDDAGLVTRSSSVSEVITDRPPDVTFAESSATVPTGTPVILTITTHDPDGAVTSIAVSWGDGRVDILAGNATSDSHSYSTAGSYNIYINATDNADLTTQSGVVVETVTDRPPAVSFTVSATTASTGTPIALTISAFDPDGTIQGLAVFWGDGTVDTLAGTATTDSHAYQLPGIFTVSANATDNAGLVTSSSPVTETVTDRPPDVTFTESSTTIPTGTPIVLTITAHDADGTVTMIDVSWGDGRIDVLAGNATSDSHSYSTAGSYSIYINATDNSSQTTRSSVSTITVTDRPPIVNISEPSTAAPTGTPVTVTISASDPDGAVTIIDVSWGDGTVQSLAGNTTMATHAYSVAGSYAVYVNATDNSGHTTQSSLDHVLISDRPPLASFSTSSTKVLTDVPITFNASSSIDPDGTITDYTWVFGDNSTNASGALAAHTFGRAGNYTVTLSVTDDAGLSSTSSVIVNILDQPPTALAIAPTFVVVGQNTSFDASSSFDPDGTIVSFSWNFGDNTTATGSTVQHSFETIGVFTVLLTVTDNNGSVNSIPLTITVISEPAGGGGGRELRN